MLIENPEYLHLIILIALMLTTLAYARMAWVCRREVHFTDYLMITAAHALAWAMKALLVIHDLHLVA